MPLGGHLFSSPGGYSFIHQHQHPPRSSFWDPKGCLSVTPYHPFGTYWKGAGICMYICSVYIYIIYIFIHPQIPSTNGWWLTTTWPRLNIFQDAFCVFVSRPHFLGRLWSQNQPWSCTPLSLRQAGFQPRAICHVLFLRPLVFFLLRDKGRNQKARVQWPTPCWFVDQQSVDRRNMTNYCSWSTHLFPSGASLDGIFEPTHSELFCRGKGFPCKKHAIWWQDVWTFGMAVSDETFATNIIFSLGFLIRKSSRLASYFICWERQALEEEFDLNHLNLPGIGWTISFLLGTNISQSKACLKMMFLFPRWDMLVPWRVSVLNLWVRIRDIREFNHSIDQDQKWAACVMCHHVLIKCQINHLPI